MKAVSMRNKHVAYLIASWVINSHLYSLPKFKKVSVRDVSKSSTLKIVVDREKEIRAFKEEEFWSIDALFNKTIEASLVEFENEKIEKMTITNGDRAHAIKEKLLKEAFKVALLEKKERESSPSPSFMTSTLQQSASSALGYSPKKTMMIAQTLYEGVKTHQGVQGVHYLYENRLTQYL